MMEVYLDSNFIISCIRKQIDFISLLKEEGFKIVVPQEVLHELKDLRSETGHDDRVAIDTAFDLFSKYKIKQARLGGRTVDEGLIEKGKTGIYIATLDNGIRKMIPHKISIRNARRDLLIEPARP